MSEVTKEVLARIEKALKESDDDFIKEIREDYGDDLNEIVRGIMYEDDLETIVKYAPGLEYVDQGHQGDGTEAYFVMKDTATGTNVGFEGWYSSAEGYEFEDCDLVEMKPFTVTHWTKK